MSLPIARRATNAWRAVMLLGAVIAAALVAFGLRGKAAAYPPIALDELQYTPLPRDYAVAGVTFGASDDLVVWGVNHAGLMLVSAGHVANVGATVLPRPVAASVDPSRRGFEVVDSQVGAVVRISAAGRELGRAALGAPVAITTAVRVTDGWIVGGVDARHRFRLFRQAGQRLLPLGDVDVDGVGFDARQVRLSAVGDRPFVNVRRGGRPVTLGLRADGRVDLTLAAGAEALAAVRKSAAANALDPVWFPLATIGVRGGYLQSLADLRSDARALVLFDARGRVVRVTSLAAPVTIAAANSEGTRMVAVRDVGTQEIVTFLVDGGARKS